MMSADFARSDWQRDAEFGKVVAKSLALQTAFLLSQLDSLASSGARLDASRALLCASRFFVGNKARVAQQAGFDLLASELAGSRAGPWPHARLAKAQALMEWNLLSVPGADAAFLAKELLAAMGELESVLMPNGSLTLLGPEARLGQDGLADLAALAAVRIESPPGNPWRENSVSFLICTSARAGRRDSKAWRIQVWIPQDHVNAGAEILRIVGQRNSALAISARLPASPGEHQDFMSYELTLDNHRVVVDSGGFAPEESEYFPRARAHNLLLVDDLEPRWQSAEGSARVGLGIPPRLGAVADG